MEQLDEQAGRLLAVLTEVLPRAVPGRPETYIGYKDVHDRLGLPYHGGTYGDSLKRQGLMSLAEWTVANNLPAITGLVINTETYRPGSGYFAACGKDEEDFAWWKDQIRLAKAFDWSPFLPDAELPPSPPAADFDVPPERQEITAYRILRDTRIALRVKRIHRHECQVCGSVIELPDGSRYAEAHHIQPLGRPHNGPDTAGNILCLCPNHHAELDYGVRPLDLGKLHSAAGHDVDERYVRYHNERIHGQVFRAR